MPDDLAYPDHGIDNAVSFTAQCLATGRRVRSWVRSDILGKTLDAGPDRRRSPRRGFRLIPCLYCLQILAKLFDALTVSGGVSLSDGIVDLINVGHYGLGLLYVSKDRLNIIRILCFGGHPLCFVYPHPQVRRLPESICRCLTPTRCGLFAGTSSQSDCNGWSGVRRISCVDFLCT